MKLKKFLYGAALCIAASSLTISCKKNDLAVNDPVSKPVDVKNFGVVPDDPKLVAKVPMIISESFLRTHMPVPQTSFLRTSPGKGGPKTSTTDNTAPVATIISPANSSSFEPAATINVQSSATDNIGVTSLSFSVDGVVQGSTSASQYTFSWNTTGASSGTHTLSVTAQDAAGNRGSASILISLNSTIIITPPSTSGYQIAMPPVTNQGSEGSCASFAIGYYTRSAEHYYRTNATTYTYSTNILSPEYLFDQTKQDASCSGSSVYVALEFLKNNGICTWQSMPYSSSNGCSLIPTSAQTAEAANFKIASYSQVSTSDITAIKTLLSGNHPLVFSFMVDSYFYNAGPGFVWRSISSTTIGRHAVSICGYDDSKHAVKVINSWGTSWGDSGYSWIDYDLLPSLNSIVYVMN